MTIGPFITPWRVPSYDPVIWTTLERSCSECGGDWTARDYVDELCPVCWPTMPEGLAVVNELGNRGVVSPQGSPFEPGEEHGFIVNVLWPNGTSSYVSRLHLKPLGYIRSSWERLDDW